MIKCPGYDIEVSKKSLACLMCSYPNDELPNPTGSKKNRSIILRKGSALDLCSNYNFIE